MLVARLRLRAQSSDEGQNCVAVLAIAAVAVGDSL